MEPALKNELSKSASWVSGKSTVDSRRGRKWAWVMTLRWAPVMRLQLIHLTFLLVYPHSKPEAHQNPKELLQSVDEGNRSGTRDTLQWALTAAQICLHDVRSTPRAAQISSVAQLCPTLCNPIGLGGQACHASLSITNSRSVLKLMSIESVMPSNHLIHCRPLLFPPSIFPSSKVFSNESVLRIR